MKEIYNPNDLVKGMRQMKNKNIIVDYHSKKSTWDIIGVPANIKDQLFALGFDKPSIIQAVSIPEVLAAPTDNFLFQAMNGSGKTGAFAIPALMKVDTKKGLQILILANTRELIR